MDKQLYDKGMSIRKEVLGAAYVEAAVDGVTEFARPFQNLLNEYCWGAVWGGDALDRRQHSLLNLGMLAAQGRMTEWELHFKAAFTNGLSEAELQETLLQIAVYCGMPTGVECFRIAKRVLEERAAETTD